MAQTHTFSADGNKTFKVPEGAAFSVFAVGDFGSGTLSVQASTSAAKAQAALTTSLTGDDNDLVITRIIAGEAGNAVTVEFADPSANDAALSVAVTPAAIVVNLATDSEGTITSTAAEVAAALAADPVFAQHFTVANADSNDGSGVVTALAETNLTGGTEGTFATLAGGYTGTGTANFAREYRNVGGTDAINLNLASSTSPDIDVVVQRL